LGALGGRLIRLRLQPTLCITKLSSWVEDETSPLKRNRVFMLVYAIWVHGFDFSLFYFDFWDYFWISLVISRYKWWFDIVSLNWWLGFSCMLDIHCVSFYGYIWFSWNYISFVICGIMDSLNDLNYFWSKSRTYLRLVWKNSKYVWWVWD
jgi:hypothetical protein